MINWTKIEPDNSNVPEGVDLLLTEGTYTYDGQFEDGLCYPVGCCSKNPTHFTIINLPETKNS